MTAYFVYFARLAFDSASRRLLFFSNPNRNPNRNPDLLCTYRTLGYTRVYVIICATQNTTGTVAYFLTSSPRLVILTFRTVDYFWTLSLVQQSIDSFLLIFLGSLHKLHHAPSFASFTGMTIHRYPTTTLTIRYISMLPCTAVHHRLKAFNKKLHLM
jgi:hypothetical protein